ncbi:MATE family efflux transporter [Spiroplasma endosymbiont of Labia minor]|uniref:MATE family efflux transporter n=1 Tax=Spiroplasma endosymbiont of Labia minor TaxID=3066305 RepID=UPI0030D5FB64
MDLKVKKPNIFFASKNWYKIALPIIIWAVFQEIIMQATDIIDNIFVNYVNDVDGLAELHNMIENSGWLNISHSTLSELGLGGYYGNAMNYNAGQLSVNGTSASNQIYTIMFASMSGFCYGAGIYSAQYFGAGKYEKLREVTAIKIYITITIGCIFALLALPNITEVLIGFTTNNKIIEKPDFILSSTSSENEIRQWFAYIQSKAANISTNIGSDYYRIISSSYIFLAINESLITSLRDTKRPFFSFWMSVIALITNGILNVFLTAPNFLGNFKGLGVEGCAIATYSSRILQLIFVISLCLIKRFEFLPHKESWLVSRYISKKIFSKALPILLNEILFSVGVVMQVKMRSMYSVESLTANAMFSTVQGLIFFPLYHGFSAGVSIFVGNELGANRMDVAKTNAHYLLTLGLITGIIAGWTFAGISYFIPNLLFSNSNPEAKRIAFWFMFIYGIIYPFIMVTNCCYATIRTGGAVWSALIMDSAFVWIVQIPVLSGLILAQVNNLIKMDIVYIQMLLMSSEIIKFIWAFIVYSRKKWVRNLTIEEHTKEIKKMPN